LLEGIGGRQHYNSIDPSEQFPVELVVALERPTTLEGDHPIGTTALHDAAA